MVWSGPGLEPILGSPFSRQDMEPGWSPRQFDPSPYFQVDLLQPFFITAVATQGGGRSGGFVSGYRLLYSNDGVHFWNYSKPGYSPATSLQAQVWRPPTPTPLPIPEGIQDRQVNLASWFPYPRVSDPGVECGWD